MLKKSIYNLILSASVLTVSACQDGQHSIEWYQENKAERLQIIAKCQQEISFYSSKPNENECKKAQAAEQRVNDEELRKVFRSLRSSSNK